MKENKIPESIRILSIGNSFSVDTMEYVADILSSIGVRNIMLGNLYIGGCSVKRHYANAKDDLPAYKYYTNHGSGWEMTPDFKISDALKSEDWDWVSIQHGTGDGSRYTSEESYSDLPMLIEYVKAIVPEKTEIAFNMAWVGEAYKVHHEIVSYDGDMKLMYQKLTDVTERLIAPMEGIDTVIPTGTAVQNARAACPEIDFTRDGFHLSYSMGRYIAGITFVSTLLRCVIEGLDWTPENVSDDEKMMALEYVRKACRSPFAVS